METSGKLMSKLLRQNKTELAKQVIEKTQRIKYLENTRNFISNESVLTQKENVRLNKTNKESKVLIVILFIVIIIQALIIIC